MGSPTTPQHGKLASVFLLRPYNFKGAGLNDAVFNTGYNGAASGYFEVVIDTIGTPDKFKWRKNGGGWTSTVSITGAAQALSDSVTVTFGATTGHTLNDQWTQGNLKVEACSVVGANAQITDATKRLLNPNAPPVFTDSGGKNVLIIDYTRGLATFDGNAGTVTVTGNNGYMVESGLQKIGYLFDWSFNVKLDVGDASRCGQNWKEILAGQAGGDGAATAYFIGTETLLNVIQNQITSGAKFLLELYNYDPNQNQTGDHFLAWAVFSQWNLGAKCTEVVKEAISFQLHGIPSFVASQ
jgi:hypothetical protein